MDTEKQIQALKTNIRALEKQKEKEDFKKLNQKYGLSKNDIVEFIYSERDGDYDYKYHWSNGKIIGLCTNSESILLSGGRTVHPSKVSKFNENDYTLRHELWYNEMNLGDEFQLIMDKPKSTKGKIYSVFKIVEQIGENTEYWYYNDLGKLQTLYEGEFHVIKDTRL